MQIEYYNISVRGKYADRSAKIQVNKNLQDREQRDKIGEAKDGVDNKEIEIIHKMGGIGSKGNQRRVPAVPE